MYTSAQYLLMEVHFHRVREHIRLEENSIIQSNTQPSMEGSTLKHIPKYQIHVPFEHPKMVTPPMPWADHFNVR